MDKKNLKKYLQIIGIYKFSQLKEGSISKFCKFQKDKILQSNVKEEKKNYLLKRLDRSMRLLSHFSEEEIINILKYGKEETNTFEMKNPSSDNDDWRSDGNNTGFNKLTGRISKDQTFDEWIQSIIGFELNGCLLFLIYILFVPTPIFWGLFIFWLLRRERD